MRTFMTDDYLAWHCDWCDSRNLVQRAFHHDVRLHCSACHQFTFTVNIEFTAPCLQAA